MSVIIQGLKLPTYQGEHKEFDRYGCFLTIYKNGEVELHVFENDYTIEEIHTPHGRLIDADELETHVDNWWDIGEYVFADTIRNADTIIEAEVSE